MQIKKTNLEDLAILKLFVNKLEEELNNKSLNYFDVRAINESIRFIQDSTGYRLLEYEQDSCIAQKHIKRICIMFNSKGIFDSFWEFRSKSSEDASQDAGGTSKLEIEWDYLTNVFNVSVILDEFNKITTPSGFLPKKNENIAQISWDFGYENRRDIKLIKIRLGKLYKKIFEYKKNKIETDCRKTLIDVAVKAFPDFVDSLILGGSDEK
jgi:hypothetical protein